MSISRRSLLLAGAGLLLAPGVHAANTWPTRPLRLIVTFPPGGASDIAARLLAPIVAETLGQAIVIENKPGAGSTIGANLVAKAAPDGYTLLASNSAPLAISPFLLGTGGYDPLADFSHVSYIGAVPTAFVVHPSVPVQDFAGLIAWIRAQPQAVQYGSGGLASVGQIVGELFAQATGLPLEHIPYKGAANMRQDLLAGHIPMAIDALPQNLPLAQSGHVRLLAVTTPARVPQAPQVPAVGELGYPQLVAENFVGISAPAGLAAPVRDRLHAAFADALQRPAVRAQLEQQGFVLDAKSPDAFTHFVQGQGAAWGPVVRASGASL